MRQKTSVRNWRFSLAAWTHEEQLTHESLLGLDELTDRVNSEEGCYSLPDVAEIKETLKDATADRRKALARGILGRLIRQDLCGANGERVLLSDRTGR